MINTKKYIKSFLYLEEDIKIFHDKIFDQLFIGDTYSAKKYIYKVQDIEYIKILYSIDGLSYSCMDEVENYFSCNYGIAIKDLYDFLNQNHEGVNYDIIEAEVGIEPRHVVE